MPEGRTRGGQAEDGLRVPSSSALGAAGGAYTCNLGTFATDLRVRAERPVGQARRDRENMAFVFHYNTGASEAGPFCAKIQHTQYGPDMAATNQGTPLKDHARAPRSASRARTSARAAT